MKRIAPTWIVLLVLTAPVAAAEDVGATGMRFSNSAFEPHAEGHFEAVITRHVDNGRRSKAKSKRVQVLLPSDYDANQSYRVVYFLSAIGRLDPVLPLLRETGLHDRHRVICVVPEMGGWYGNHPTDATRRSADYLERQVVPLVEGHYPVVAGKEGRLLLGFSKSGWGALSLIACRPEVFGYAASWDAPLDWSTDSFGKIGTGQAYGTLEAYRYHHPQLAISRNVDAFRERKRLVITGRKFWGKHSGAYHRHLDTLGVPHHFDDSLRIDHNWNATWLVPTMDALIALTKEDKK